MNPIQENFVKLAALFKKYKARNMYAFGSVLPSRFNDESDIDLLVNFLPEMDYLSYTENYFRSV